LVLIASVALTAEPDPKVNVIFCTWSGCGPCQRMKTDTLSDPAVVYRVNIQTLEWSNPADAAKIRELKVTSFPTYFTVDASGKIMQRGGGYMGARDFLNWLK
jgi:thioredoxin-related protein